VLPEDADPEGVPAEPQAAAIETTERRAARTPTFLIRMKPPMEAGMGIAR
jgi:hypothetical protein